MNYLTQSQLKYEFIEEDKKITIDSIIFVKKNSQKGMVIGKDANMIKQID